MGDATTNIGAWHESLNLAQLWKLPVVFLIVNNQFGMGTSVEKASAEPELYKKACAFGMHGERVDGNDVLAVRDAALRAVELARDEKLPTVMEAVSFRLRGHSVVDPDRYRARERSSRARRKTRSRLRAAAARRRAAGRERPEARSTPRSSAMVERAIDFADESARPQPRRICSSSTTPPRCRTRPHAPAGRAACSPMLTGGR